jgi:protein-disulfide isomerase
MVFLRSFRSAALGLTCLLAVAGYAERPEAAPLEPAQRTEVESIIREYLIRNPEVIQEAIAELERRQGEAQKVAQVAALRDSADALFRSKHATEVGNPTGDVTVVEFFDYNCGYCKRALGDIQAMTKSDPKLRVVLKDFPVLGPESLEASKLALAARQQIAGDKLFDFHSRLLGSRTRVNGERALAVAREMGLDLARLKADADGAEVRAALAENADLGEKLGVNGTPAFVIGDEVIAGAVGVEPLRAAVASVRRCGRAAC